MLRRACPSKAHRNLRLLCTRPTSSFFAVSEPEPHVKLVELNRPQTSNAINHAAWGELQNVFQSLGEDKNCRAIVITGTGKHFCAGIDLNEFLNTLFPEDHPTADVARRSLALRDLVGSYQRSVTAIENVPQPVIAAVDGACIGGGVDIISACDIRYCSSSAMFSIKEVDVGLAADLGTLQRLPKILGNGSLVRELAFTGRMLHASEALVHGMVSKVLEDREALLEGALRTASAIASKSPVAVTATKASLNYSRDHTVAEGLDHIASWNMALLQSEDVKHSVKAFLNKTETEYSNLV